MVSAGMDLENPRPLQVFVGVLTSVTTGFFNIALEHRIYNKMLDIFNIFFKILMRAVPLIYVKKSYLNII